MLNVIFDPFLTRKIPFFTLFILSRTSDNTTSPNIGGTNAWAVPHLKIWGDRPPQSPLGLRPWLYWQMDERKDKCTDGSTKRRKYVRTNRSANRRWTIGKRTD